TPGNPRQQRQPSQPIQWPQIFWHRLALRTIPNLAQQRRIIPRFQSKHGQSSRTRLKLSRYNLNQRALARAIRPNQSSQPCLDLEADIVQPHHDAVPAAEFECLDYLHEVKIRNSKPETRIKFETGNPNSLVAADVRRRKPAPELAGNLRKLITRR